jgi:ubiquinone biosynthesis UbiH/UbiF/VisC/COQ6 family hydroxylase
VKSGHDIIVVGGGPVGAAAALALRDAGFDVALVEREAAAPRFDPGGYDLRVYAVAPQAATFLDALCVWQPILGARACAYGAMRVWERGAPRGLTFDRADVRAAQLGWIVENNLIVDRLWARFGAMPVYRNAAIDELAVTAATATLHLGDGRSLRARLLVAADGAESTLRALAGIDTTGWHYGQRAIVCHVATAEPHRDTAWQCFLDGGTIAYLPLADGRSSIVWSAEQAQAEEMLALDDATFAQRLAEASDFVLGEVRVTTRRIAFPLRLQHAQSYVGERLVLIGDAAHTVHPLAGQGVNLGLADAQELAAVLASARDARRDWSSPRVLARYARARRAANTEMLALTDVLNRAFRLQLPGARELLGLGLEAVDRVAPLRGWLARRAAGL